MYPFCTVTSAHEAASFPNFTENVNVEVAAFMSSTEIVVHASPQLKAALGVVDVEKLPYV
jgi:hypothetical protein